MNSLGDLFSDLCREPSERSSDFFSKLRKMLEVLFPCPFISFVRSFVGKIYLYYFHCHPEEHAEYFLMESRSIRAGRQ